MYDALGNGEFPIKPGKKYYPAQTIECIAISMFPVSPRSLVQSIPQVVVAFFRQRKSHAISRTWGDRKKSVTCHALECRAARSHSDSYLVQEVVRSGDSRLHKNQEKDFQLAQVAKVRCHFIFPAKTMSF